MSYVKGVSMFPSDVPSSVVTKSFMLVELRLGLKEQSMFVVYLIGGSLCSCINRCNGPRVLVGS